MQKRLVNTNMYTAEIDIDNNMIVIKDHNKSTIAEFILDTVPDEVKRYKYVVATPEQLKDPNVTKYVRTKYTANVNKQILQVSTIKDLVKVLKL